MKKRKKKKDDVFQELFDFQMELERGMDSERREKMLRKICGDKRLSKIFAKGIERSIKEKVQSEATHPLNLSKMSKKIKKCYDLDKLKTNQLATVAFCCYKESYMESMYDLGAHKMFAYILEKKSKSKNETDKMWVYLSLWGITELSINTKVMAKLVLDGFFEIYLPFLQHEYIIVRYEAARGICQMCFHPLGWESFFVNGVYKTFVEMLVDKQVDFYRPWTFHDNDQTGAKVVRVKYNLAINPLRFFMNVGKVPEILLKIDSECGGELKRKCKSMIDSKNVILGDGIVARQSKYVYQILCGKSMGKHEDSCHPAKFNKTAKLRKCLGCKKEESVGNTFKVCGNCKRAHYCGVKCQRSDWKVHKKDCQKLKEKKKKNQYIKFLTKAKRVNQQL